MFILLLCKIAGVDCLPLVATLPVQSSDKERKSAVTRPGYSHIDEGIALSKENPLWCIKENK